MFLSFRRRFGIASFRHFYDKKKTFVVCFFCANGVGPRTIRSPVTACTRSVGRNKLKCTKKNKKLTRANIYSGRKYGGRPIKDYNPDYLRQTSRLSPRSSLRSSISDFTDTTISTWNQRHPQAATEYPSVLSDRLKILDRDRINTFQRRIEFDTSNLHVREPGTSYADNVYRTSIQDRMESLSDQLTKVLSTGAGSSHINGSLADSGIQTDNTSTSVPQIYIETQTHTPKYRDAAVDTRNENNLQEIPFIDEDDDDSKYSKKRSIILEKHKSMSNIPERIDEVSSKEQSNERLSSSFNRAKSPTFVEKFKKFFIDIGLVKSESTPNTETNANTLPKSLNSSYRTRSASPAQIEPREASTLPKDMRFRKVRSTQTVYIKQESPLLIKKDQEVQTKEHVSVVQLNGDEHIRDSESEKLMKEVVYIKSIEKAEIYTGNDSGSTIIVIPPAD